jgi:hypothetical protein
MEKKGKMERELVERVGQKKGKPTAFISDGKM